MWGGGALATWIAYHSPYKLGDPVTMLPFSFIAYFWLARELQSSNTPWRWLALCGAASYSLYLVHELVMGGVDDYIYPVPPVENVLVRVIGAAVCTYVFYKLVEAPSHVIARKVANSIAVTAIPKSPSVVIPKPTAYLPSQKRGEP